MSIRQAQGGQGFLERDDLVVEKRALKEPVNEAAWDFLNETQLWFIYLGLDRLSLVPELQIGTRDLARRVHKYGGRKYHWLKG